MYSNAAENLVVHGARRVTGIDSHINPAPVSTKAPPAWTALEGQGRPQGVIGLGGGELHHNGTHWRSLLNLRKDRVPNGNVGTIRRLRAASASRFDLRG